MLFKDFFFPQSEKNQNLFKKYLKYLKKLFNT